MADLFELIARTKNELGSLSQTAKQTADDVEQSAQRVNRVMDDTRERTKRGLGDLEAYIEQHSGPFAEELRLQLDLLEIGGQRLDAFIGKLGNAVITTEDGVKKVRDIVQGLDARGFEEEILAMARAAQQGGEALAAAIDLLREKGGKLTEQLVKAIEAFQRGEGSLDRVRRLVEQIGELTGGGTALDELGEGILEGLRDGTFG